MRTRSLWPGTYRTPNGIRNLADPHILLVVLQNAYDKGRLKRGYNPSSWRKEFERSRTGERLREALPDRFQWQSKGPSRYAWDIRYTNASPVLGKGPDSKPRPNLAHLRRRLKAVGPTVVLACGKMAEGAILQIWDGPLIVIPHPASRVLTEELTERAKKMLEAIGVFISHPNLRKGWVGDNALVAEADIPRFALRQRRGFSEVEAL